MKIYILDPMVTCETPLSYATNDYELLTLHKAVFKRLSVGVRNQKINQSEKTVEFEGTATVNGDNWFRDTTRFIELTKTNQEVKWSTLDSVDGNRSLSQHGFIGCDRGWDQYEGNRTLCSSQVGADDGEGGGIYATMDGIKSELFNEDTACKKCLKIYNEKYNE